MLHRKASRISLDVRNSEAYAKRAWVYNNMESFQTAVADATKAIRLNPRDSDAYEARAWAYTALGKMRLAELDRVKSARIPPMPDERP